MNRLINLDRYPVDKLDQPEGQALIDRCRESLDATAAATLPGFLRREALTRLTTEAQDLIPGSRRFAEAPRVTFPEGDAADGTALGAEVRAMKHANSYNQILNYQIPNNSDLRAVYLWPMMTEFVRRVRNVEELHLSQCPHLALTMKAAFEDDTDGWHYDPNDGVVTLLLQMADKGGEFEYAPNIRSDDDQNYDGVKRLFENPDMEGRRISQSPGDFTFFNGRNSMHRVKPVGKTTKPRIVAIFSYDQRPDQVFGNYYIKMIHTLPQGAPK
ncbi:MAG: HalD/BesD family halogenase [Boseongicola sp.]